ncbi:hypothetical protein [Mycobacterium sp.]|uniref:hypothetical protein n=1 Tax=Mycobacterium sp. TaxID=1785 RepID=UPI003F9B7B2C
MPPDRLTAAAVIASEEALAQVTRLRGPKHPETLVKRAQLARDRARAGDFQGAISDYENLLPDLVRVLGRGNTGTLDIGTALPTERPKAGEQRDTIADYERRAQDLLDRVKATYSPLL